METGDPKQLAALGVAAVGALGFLGFRTLAHPAPLPSKALAMAETRKAEPTLRLLPPASDPFSHPRLAPPKKTKEPETAPDRSPIGGKLGPLPVTSFGPLPGVGPLAPTGIRPVETPGMQGGKPMAPEGTSVGLEAIVSASDAVAFLSVEGGDSLPFRKGDRVTRKVRLVRFVNGGVVLQGPKGELTLAVGERIRT